MIPEQYEFFEENDDISLIRRGFIEMKKSLDKRTRAQFALINEMSKEIIALKDEIYITRSMMIQRRK